MRLNAKYKKGESVLLNANQRRRFGEAYKPLFAKIAGEAALGGEATASCNTLTLNWRKPAVDPDAGKPSKKAKPKTRRPTGK